MSISSGTSENILIGYIDSYRRPFVRLSFYGFDRLIEAMVDTGFTSEILADADFATRSGFEFTGIIRMATLASGQDQKFQIWRGEIDWFGEKRSVDLDVPDIERHHDDRSSTNRRTSIVIGTKLLSFCKLEIDFIDRALKIIKLM